MPIRLPGPDAIRRRIAEYAADATSARLDHYLELIGPVEPASRTDGGETSWRLAYYQGSRIEHQAIERAVGVVQRLNPLMRTG